MSGDKPKKSISAKETLEAAQNRVLERLNHRRCQMLFEGDIWGVRGAPPRTPPQRSRKERTQTYLRNAKSEQKPSYVRVGMIQSYDTVGHGKVRYPNMEKILRESTGHQWNNSYMGTLQKQSDHIERERREASKAITYQILQRTRQKTEKALSKEDSCLTWKTQSARTGTDYREDANTEGVPSLTTPRKQQHPSPPSRKTHIATKSLRSTQTSKHLVATQSVNTVVANLKASKGRSVGTRRNAEENLIKSRAKDTKDLTYEERIEERRTERTAFEALHMQKLAWLMVIKLSLSLKQFRCLGASLQSEQAIQHHYKPKVVKIQQWWKAKRLHLVIEKSRHKKDWAADLLRQHLRKRKLNQGCLSRIVMVWRRKLKISQSACNSYVNVTRARIEMLAIIWDKIALREVSRRIKKSLTKELQLSKKIFELNQIGSNSPQHDNRGQRRSSAPSVMKTQDDQVILRRSPRIEERISLFRFLPRKAVEYLLRESKFLRARTKNIRQLARKHEINERRFHPSNASFLYTTSNSSPAYILSVFVRKTTARPSQSNIPSYLRRTKSEPRLRRKKIKRNTNRKTVETRRNRSGTSGVEFELPSALFERIGKDKKQSHMFVAFAEELRQNWRLPQRMAHSRLLENALHRQFRRHRGHLRSMETKLKALLWSLQPVLPSPLLKIVCLDFLLRVARDEYIQFSLDWSNDYHHRFSLDEIRNLLKYDRSKADKMLNERYIEAQKLPQINSFLLLHTLKKIWQRLPASHIYSWVRQFEETVRLSIWEHSDAGVYSERTLAAHREYLFRRIRERKSRSEEVSCRTAATFLMEPFVEMYASLAQEAWHGFTSNPEILIT